MVTISIQRKNLRWLRAGMTNGQNGVELKKGNREILESHVQTQ